MALWWFSRVLNSAPNYKFKRTANKYLKHSLEIFDHKFVRSSRRAAQPIAYSRSPNQLQDFSLSVAHYSWSLAKDLENGKPFPVALRTLAIFVVYWAACSAQAWIWSTDTDLAVTS